MADISLDDIIKKKKPQSKTGFKGRGGIHKPSTRSNLRLTVAPRKTQLIADARLKIIQKNREKLTDARDKLVQIAKQTDARLKLEKLRAIHKPQTLFTVSRKTSRNGKISLSTNRIPPLVPNYDAQLSYISPRVVGYRETLGEPTYMENMSLDYEDNYVLDVPLRRTVSNEYAPGPPPLPPVFGIKPSVSHSWAKSTPSIRKPVVEQSKEYKIVPRIPIGQTIIGYRDDWNFGGKTRTISAEGPDEKYFMRSHREIAVKARLQSSESKSRPMEILARAKNSSSAISSQSTGFRIVVSNLQANVTQEDIKELFEDVGELLVSRLVRPGTAEVIYKTLKDATKAVETYHNRQLDGHPMKCLLVNPRPKNNPTAPAVRPLAESRRAAKSRYVQPSLGAVHRALFDD